MNEPTNSSRRPRWFQFSLRTLLVLMLVIGAYFAGFATSEKLARKAIEDAREKAAAELEEAKQAAMQAQLLAEQQRAAAALANWQLRGNVVLTK